MTLVYQYGNIYNTDAIKLFLEGEGETIVDSTNKHSITTYNSAQISNIESKYGSSSLFFPTNGTSFLVTERSTDLTLALDNFTIEFWIKWDHTYLQTGGNSQTIISNGTTVFGPNKWTININIDEINEERIGIVSFQIFGSGIQYSTSSPISNDWTHYAFVRSNSTMYAFCNGILEGTFSNTQSFSGLLSTVDIHINQSDYTLGNSEMEIMQKDSDVLQITIPFEFSFAGINYGNNKNGGVYLNANSSVTFGLGYSEESSLSVPTLHIGSVSNVAFDNVYTKFENNEYIVRYEGTIKFNEDNDDEDNEDNDDEDNEDNDDEDNDDEDNDDEDNEVNDDENENTIIWELVFKTDNTLILNIKSHAFPFNTSIISIGDSLSFIPSLISDDIAGAKAIIETKGGVLFGTPSTNAVAGHLALVEEVTNEGEFSKSLLTSEFDTLYGTFFIDGNQRFTIEWTFTDDTRSFDDLFTKSNSIDEGATYTFKVYDNNNTLIFTSDTTSRKWIFSANMQYDSINLRNVLSANDGIWGATISEYLDASSDATIETSGWGFGNFSSDDASANILFENENSSIGHVFAYIYTIPIKPEQMLSFRILNNTQYVFTGLHSLPDDKTQITIGGSPADSKYFYGYIDQLRIIKDDIYTKNFTIKDYNNRDYIPVYDTLSTYDVGALVYHDGLVFYAYSYIQANITPTFEGLSNWIQYWEDDITYDPDTFVHYLGIVYYTSDAQSQNTIPHLALSLEDWIPIWKDSTYEKEQFVYFEGDIYYSNTTTSAQPTFPDTNEEDWVLVWKPGRYPIGSFVYYEGHIYYRDIFAWSPVWFHATYDKGAFAYYRGTMYFNNKDNNSDVPMTLINTNNTWLPIWVSGIYNKGEFVYHQGVVYYNNGEHTSDEPSFPNTNDNSWISVWNSTDTYTSASFVYFESYIYYANQQTTNVIPSTPNQIKWVEVWNPRTYLPGITVYYNDELYISVNETNTEPISLDIYEIGNWKVYWRIGVSYPKNAIVYLLGLFYFNNKSENTYTPQTFSNVENEWLLVWKNGSYNKDMFVYHEGFVYYNNSNQTISEPTLSTTSLMNWIHVWNANYMYIETSVVYYNSSLYFAKQESYNIIPNAPDQEVWLFVWQPGVYAAGLTVIHNNIIYFSNTQTSQEPVSPSTSEEGWVVHFLQNSVLYLKGNFVYYEGRVFYSIINYNTAVPIYPSNLINGWIPLWKNEITYSKKTVVYHQGVVYYNNLIEASTMPSFPNTSLMNWIPVWNAETTYNKSSFVFYLSYIYYANDESKNMIPDTPNQMKWVITWKPGSYPMGMTIYYDGVIYFSSTQVSDEPQSPSVDKIGWIPYWQTESTYSINNFVYYEGLVFKNTTDSNTSKPSITTIENDWVPVWTEPFEFKFILLGSHKSQSI